MRATRVLARLAFLAALAATPAVVYAQDPAPPPSPQPPAEQAPPPDDGPKPAGVGTSTPPPTVEDPLLEDATPATFPATFPGVPVSGIAPSATPFRGLFGGAEPIGRQKHALNLSGSIFAAYSTNIGPSPTVNPLTETFDQDSRMAGGSGSVVYSRQWDAAQFGAQASGGQSWVAAYEDSGDPWLTRWSAGVDGGFSKRVGSRTNFSASGSADYSPYLTYGTFGFLPGTITGLPVDTPGLDHVQTRDPSVRSNAHAQVSWALTRTSSVEAYYSLTAQTFVSSDPQNFDRLDHTVGGRYRYQFGRYVGLRAGYGYQRSTLGGPDGTPWANHFIDLGVDAGYGRSYALTRRTTFAFSTDSGVFTNQRSSTQSDEGFDPDTRLFVGGNASLTQTIGRTWSATAGYNRAVNYTVGFVEPMLSDSAYASLGGLFTTRLDFTATAHYTTGQVGFSGQQNGYGTSSANAVLRYAVTRNLAAYAQYFYYHYMFESGVTRPDYLKPQLDRQGVSVGLTAWLPLIGSRGRR